MQRDCFGFAIGSPMAISAGPLSRIPSFPPAPHLSPGTNGPYQDYPRQGCGALVLGGAHGSLGVVRSLGRHNIPVWFVTDNNILARFSRYTRRSLSWPGPHDAGATEFLLELGHRHQLGGWLLLPGGDEEARLVAQNHTALSAMFRVTTPPWEAMQWTYDKRLTYELAAAVGLDFPRSCYPRDREEVSQLNIPFPVVLKPTVKANDNPFTLGKVWRADNRDVLLSRYDEAVAYVGKDAIVIQELIPGRGAAQFSYAAVWDRGRPIASLVARRSRQYPIEFGFTSTFVETIEQNEVAAAACRFLAPLDYHGMIEMEFKYDARDRRYKLLDVNPRTWTWISLGDAAGVDFPYILWRLAMGEPVAPHQAALGTKWIHFSRDFVAACQEMATGNLTLKDYLRSLWGSLEFAAFTKDDPLPGLIDLPLGFYRVLTRRLPMRARRVAKVDPPPETHRLIGKSPGRRSPAERRVVCHPNEHANVALPSAGRWPDLR